PLQGYPVKEAFLTEDEKSQWLEIQRERLSSMISDQRKLLSADELIALKLKREGLAFRIEKYEHSYPHCWRTDKPILYYPLDSWFVKTTAVKDRMIALNREIQWKPESTGTGRFGNWLENLVDWNLSRSRYWGTPLPIWSTDDGLERRCIGSIEELREAVQEAKAANTLKDEFLATLSHELRTPAGVIGGFVELLKYERLSESESEEALDAIERNSRSLVTLIDDILDVSRVITGKFKLAPKPVDLASVVESVIAAEMLAAQAKNIRIVTEFEPGLGPVYGDTTRLQQIFWNLLSNAIKFTPRNGRVKVTLKMDGPRAIVKIADTGVGIEGQFLPHVFERFRQQDSGMNRAYGGLGLGLSIVKHLVELHGGLVTAESEGKGKGSIFTVSLPVLTAAG
ncbi:hypothetical protein EBR21_01515, partial [bacterium]|nr:hypothetical protein [bacterium]